jgi:hypothetical protein
MGGVVSQFNFDQICKFKVGEEYVESCQMGNLFFVVVTEPVVEGDQVTFIGRCLKTGRDVDYMINKKYQHYGPQIYKEQQYFTMKEIEERLQKSKESV